MTLKNFLIRSTAVVIVLVTLFSCDDEFNTVGSEVIGDVNFEDRLYEATPVAYSARFERVQTSALPGYLLGVYNDPVYGQSAYGVLSELQPERFDPVFGDNARLDSVVLNIPYFSTTTNTEANDDGVIINTFELDSVYGNQPIRLSIYKSNYFLRDFDPNSNQRQLYFSNDLNDIETNFGTELKQQLLYTDEGFVPSAEELILLSPDGEDENDDPDVTRLPPAFRVKLPVDVFTAAFLDMEGSSELSNANNFRNFFRGIFFEAEAVNNAGNLMFLNMVNGDITLHYTFEKVDTADEDEDGSTTDIVEDQGTLALAFANNIVNGVDTQFDTTIANELLTENQDVVNGEETLYLKGGDGAIAVIDLFGGMIVNENGEEENELDFLRRQNWLINDASMTFYIDQDRVTGGDTEPERIYIFNMETDEVLLDYRFDNTINNDNPVVSITNHLGRISRDSNDDGEFFKVRMTQHINNILEGDTENVRLGLSVSQNVNIINNADGFARVRSDETDPNSDIEVTEKTTPFASVISHEGTVLYGNGPGVPEAKQLKLNIFYTESIDN